MSVAPQPHGQPIHDGSRETRVIRKISLIGAPTSAGAFAPGQEGAPAALRQAGLVEELRRHGHTVTDHGDTSYFRWRPDRINPHAQNLGRVRTTIDEVYARVEEFSRARDFALVLGGDCTIELGTVAGFVRSGVSVGLVYFDMHADMNTPDGPPAGALDWMGVGHMLNLPGALPQLADVSGTVPMLLPSQVVVLGHRDDQATGFERHDIQRLGIKTIPIEEVAGSPVSTAQRALSYFPDAATSVLVHFDVDVIDFTDAPLSENTGRNIGLKADTAFEALRSLLQDDRVAALTIAELNPEHGEKDGSTVRDFCSRLAGSFHRT